MKTTIQTIRDSYKINNILTATPAVHAIKPLPAELPDETGHTPGPWIDQGEGTLLHPVSGAAITTRRIETSLGFIEVFDQTNEPDSNFQLFLAAPALLASHARLVAACESAITHMLVVAGLNPERTYCYNWLVEPLEPCACHICKIRAALAAAKGQP